MFHCRWSILGCGTLIIVCSWDGLIWIGRWRSSWTNMLNRRCSTSGSCFMWTVLCPFKIPLLGNCNLYLNYYSPLFSVENLEKFCRPVCRILRFTAGKLSKFYGSQLNCFPFVSKLSYVLFKNFSYWEADIVLCYASNTQR